MPPKGPAQPKGPAPRGSVALEVEEEDVVDRPYPPHVAEFRRLPLWLAVRRAASSLLPGGGVGLPAPTCRPRLRPRADREPNPAQSKAAPAVMATEALIEPVPAAAADDDDDDDDNNHALEEPVAKRRKS